MLVVRVMLFLQSVLMGVRLVRRPMKGANVKKQKAGLSSTHCASQKIQAGTQHILEKSFPIFIPTGKGEGSAQYQRATAVE